MIQSNYFQTNPSLQEHFQSLIPWKEIIDIYEAGFRDAKTFQETGDPRFELAPATVEEALSFYEEILKTTGDISGNYVSQVASIIDKKGLQFEHGVVTHPEDMEDVVKMYHTAGLNAVAIQRKFGGLGLPNVMKALISEIMYRSDVSVTIAAGSIGLAAILERVATEEECLELIPRYIREGYTGTMGLSEPDYGSDLPEVKTKATPDPNHRGRWLLNGTKRYQTVACGINGKPGMTLVLARTGSPESGARGLSFFVAESKDYEVIGLEKKLGIKASATCEVAYENTPARLVGKEGFGLVKYVMGMLNGARLSVASQGVGQSTAAWYEAKKYAESRIQFGKPIIEIPAVKKMLDRMERETEAMRCLMIEAAYSVDKYYWYGDRDLPRGSKEAEEAKFWEKVANTLTPISKYYNSETAVQVVHIGLQVLGGAGYTEDYDLARLYRDVRIATIYDGTTQIQVNAAIGGIIAGMNPGGIFRTYLEKLLSEAQTKNGGIGAKLGKEISERLLTFIPQLNDIVQAYKSIPDRDTKEAYSFEVVESAARVILSFLMARAWGEKYPLFHLDSSVVLEGNLKKIQAC